MRQLVAPVSVESIAAALTAQRLERESFFQQTGSRIGRDGRLEPVKVKGKP